jgi:hypothetical protein
MMSSGIIIRLRKRLSMLRSTTFPLAAPAEVVKVALKTASPKAPWRRGSGGASNESADAALDVCRRRCLIGLFAPVLARRLIKLEP